MDRKLKIGNGMVLVPKEEWKDLVKDLDINSFMEKIDMSPSEYLKLRNYLLKGIALMGVSRFLSKTYSNEITTEIEVTIEGRYRGFPATIDDPDEISRFLTGEFATAIDSNGDEHFFRKESSILLDWKEVKSPYFYFKKEK